MPPPRLLSTINNYFDDLVVGDRFVSRRRTITETDIVNFAGFSGDFNPLHVDAEFAARGIFGQRVAQGALTLSVATGLEFGMLGTEESRLLAFYGMDRVRFVKPVFIGSTIHVEGEIMELVEKTDISGVVTMRQEIKDQDDVTLVVLDKRTLNAKRPTSSGGKSTTART